MYHKHVRVVSLLVLAAILAGCDYDKKGHSEDKSGSAKRDDVKLETVKFEELEKKIHEHKGKIVVVDVWAWW
jgi:thiol:disulfide interchange protein